MNDTPQDLMQAATRLTQSGQLQEATAAIQRALAGAAAQPPADHAARVNAVGMLTRAWPAKVPPASVVLDDCVFEAPAKTETPTDPHTETRLDTPIEARTPAPEAPDRGPGEFIGGTHTHASLTRRYKLYIPPGHAGKSLPLVVMLHGCTQDPDDFAAGTGMNECAREQGFFVLYPAQAQDANPSRCWNWFKHNHQRRDSGEPALLAHMTRAVIGQYGLDTRRVYIAGLSAGGAMAAIVAGLYPELFAAAGVHSGLAGGAASNLPEAMSAMKNGSQAAHVSLHRFGSSRLRPTAVQLPVATIVFHGDRDPTVHPSNGEQVIAAALGGNTGTSISEQGTSTLGRRYTRTTHVGSNGTALAEHWVIHGAGHAWSGGSAKGSYTDAKGPDATAEMSRFFLQFRNSVHTHR